MSGEEIRMWMEAIFPYFGTIVTAWTSWSAMRYFAFMRKVEEERYYQNQDQTVKAKNKSKNIKYNTSNGVKKRRLRNPLMSFRTSGIEIIISIMLVICLVFLYFYVEFNKSFVICATLISVLLAIQINRWAMKSGIDMAIKILEKGEDMFQLPNK